MMASEDKTLGEILYEAPDTLYSDNSGRIWSLDEIYKQWVDDLDRPAAWDAGTGIGICLLDPDGYMVGGEPLLRMVKP